MSQIIQTASSAQKEYRRGNVYGVVRTLFNRLSPTSIAAMTLPTTQENDSIVVYFPAMPDSIPLNRTATYTNAARTPVTPDGFHYYEHTDPLEIPVKFSLHAFDAEYCGADGPVALLNIAARLHAMAMPILVSKSGSVASGGVQAPDVIAGKTPDGSPAPDSKVASHSMMNKAGNFNASLASDASFFYPPACQLNIVMAKYGKQEIGILCDGFVTRVSALLKGPWLQGGGKNRQFYNLPTSADYEFTFTQQPGYTNSFKNGTFMNNNGVSQIVSSSCKQISERLFNTADIATPSYYVGITGSSSTGIQ
jgi:hypothetical protein